MDKSSEMHRKRRRVARYWTYRSHIRRDMAYVGALSFEKGWYCNVLSLTGKSAGAGRACIPFPIGRDRAPAEAAEAYRGSQSLTSCRTYLSPARSAPGHRAVRRRGIFLPFAGFAAEESHMVARQLSRQRVQAAKPGGEAHVVRHVLDGMPERGATSSLMNAARASPPCGRAIAVSSTRCTATQAPPTRTTLGRSLPWTHQQLQLQYQLRHLRSPAVEQRQQPAFEPCILVLACNNHLTAYHYLNS